MSFEDKDSREYLPPAGTNTMRREGTGKENINAREDEDAFRSNIHERTEEEQR